MLQRKLIINLGPLVVVLVVTAVTAMLMLQHVLARLDHASIVFTDEYQSVMRQFRGVVLGLGITFVVVINLAIVILLRMGWMILRPVNKLVDATRELSAEHFDHRVNLDENDEFDELAGAYNTLAEHLQQTEKRRMEVLSQVGVTLNHELNNAMAAIELQLGLLGRRAGEDPTIERRLRTIQTGLTRMKNIVQSLKNARRIVLTDYGDGQKMLDLVQSAQAEEPVHQVAHA